MRTKAKAKPKPKAGSMPVLGNEEPAVLARQSSNSSCVIPIKKRLSSMFHSGAPIRPDRSFSNENESKTKDSGLNSCDSTGKSDTPDNSLLEVKEERPLGAKVDDQPTILPSLSISPETNPSTTSSPSRNVDDVVKPALAEKLADVDAAAHINRSNWDLNTLMESWEGFVDDVPVQDANQIDLLRKTSSSLDIKLPISSAPVIGSNGDKGKQVVGASEQEFDLPISSIHPTVRHMSVDVPRRDLDSTLRGFDSSVLQSLGRNMNSSTVNSEPVMETLVQANAGTVVCPAGKFEANVVKTEVLKPNLQSIGLSTDGPLKLLEQIFMTSDVIAHQSIGRVLQLQENFSSSNGVDLSKNANFDLKESNVSSDKVEAPVSPNMTIEDHTVYKNTQDADNLVQSGEKMSISAGKEEEYYKCASTGHAEREDEEYEDGEIRGPKMQSIAGGMNSVHTEACDDFAKRCDEKDDKMKLQRPSLDKEVKTSDDEQRPIRAIHNETFSSNHRPGRGRSPSSGSGREKFYPPRNRDEISRYGPKFVQDRFPDRSFGSSRGDFMHGRGRHSDHSFGSSRGDFMHGRGRHSGRFHRLGRDFECYGGVADYRFRHKSVAPWIDDDRSRKPINDALPSFWHAPARQLSPNARKHADRMYDGPDGQFVQDNTKFTSMHRSGFPRRWSRSPVRSHTWSCPQRRLTEGFSGHRDSSQHRPPVMQREDRMRSSSQTPFNKEALAPQRRDSSSYTARNLNDMKDVDRGHRDSSQHRSSVMHREDGMRSSSQTPFTKEALAPQRRDSSSYTARHLNDMKDVDRGHRDSSQHRSSVMHREDRMRSSSQTPFTKEALAPQRRDSSSYTARHLNDMKDLDRGHRDSSQHRSSVMHREDGMRSSSQTPFTKAALAPQRRVSPSYTARHLNDMKDVHAVKEHVHPTSLASRRNPTDPVFTSSNRSVEISDHRKRADGESTEKRNVKEQEDEFDVSKLKKRRF